MECNTFGLFRGSFDTLQFLKSSMVWKNIVETNLLYHNKSSIASFLKPTCCITIKALLSPAEIWMFFFPAMPLKYIKQNSPNVDIIFVCRFLFLLCAYIKYNLSFVFPSGGWFNFIFLLSSASHAWCIQLLGSPCPPAWAAFVDELCWSNYQTEIHSFTVPNFWSFRTGKKQTFFRHKQTYFAPYICHIAIVCYEMRRMVQLLTTKCTYDPAKWKQILELFHSNADDPSLDHRLSSYKLLW